MSNPAQNSEDTLYILGTCSIGEIIDLASAHFKVDVASILHDFNIGSEYIHTRCIGYDLYDPNDYDNYIVISRK